MRRGSGFSKSKGADAFESGESLALAPSERPLPPLLMSFGIHLLLFVAIGVLWTSQPSGTGEIGQDRPIGIAMVHQLPDRQRYSEVVTPDAEDQAEESQQSSSESSPAAPPADLTPPLDLAGVLDSLQATPAPVSGTGLAGESELGGDAFADGTGNRSDGGADEVTTMLFGVSGSGTHFVYVFDRSDSMNGFSGRPLRAAKSELLKSLSSLTERQQFQIIFYNDQPKPFALPGMPLAMVRAEKSNLSLANNYVRSIAAYGGTEHESALKLALRMGPDVIFFLTDARIPRLSNNELNELQIRASTTGTTIHCIEFGADASPPLDSFLTQLAAMNSGQYRYINVRSLGQ
ncbi:hypothetical protein OAA27_00880 [bacterium]|nr:hypothetical protein [bacterium]